MRLAPGFLLFLFACAPAVSAPPPTQPSPLVQARTPPTTETATEIAVQAAPGKSSQFVAGCNVRCQNCSVIDYQTSVTGTARDGEIDLFSGSDSPLPGGGYSCSSNVRAGDNVQLVAKSSSGAFEFVGWETGSWSGDVCPCGGQAGPRCEFSVTGTVLAAKRVYCGAVWRVAEGHTIAE